MALGAATKLCNIFFKLKLIVDRSVERDIWINVTVISLAQQSKSQVFSGAVSNNLARCQWTIIQYIMFKRVLDMRPYKSHLSFHKILDTRT